MTKQLALGIAVAMLISMLPFSSVGARDIPVIGPNEVLEKLGATGYETDSHCGDLPEVAVGTLVNGNVCDAVVELEQNRFRLDVLATDPYYAATFAPRPHANSSTAAVSLHSDFMIAPAPDGGSRSIPGQVSLDVVLLGRLLSTGAFSTAGYHGNWRIMDLTTGTEVAYHDEGVGEDFVRANVKFVKFAPVVVLQTEETSVRDRSVERVEFRRGHTYRFELNVRATATRDLPAANPVSANFSDALAEFGGLDGHVGWHDLRIELFDDPHNPTPEPQPPTTTVPPTEHPIPTPVDTPPPAGNVPSATSPAMPTPSATPPSSISDPAGPAQIAAASASGARSVAVATVSEAGISTDEVSAIGAVLESSAGLVLPGYLPVLLVAVVGIAVLLGYWLARKMER
jgi:hypothetical protein